MNSNEQIDSSCDVLLIGAGIMSATLGTFLKELEPNWKICLYERLPSAASESSDAWNNAGTGHSALCELNYTPQLADGRIDISNALKVMEQFELSKQFWATLADQNKLDTDSFIRSVPHVSFVQGDAGVAYLRKRYDALQSSPLFKEMLFSDSSEKLKTWIPLVMNHRESAEKVAATYSTLGTDINFGELSRQLFHGLEKNGCELFFQREVLNLQRMKDGVWRVKIKDVKTGKISQVSAKFVFIGAGGGSLHLLQKSGIPESTGYGGFPVSGQWLVCENAEVAAKHNAKVYGKAPVGAPPMSVPHLDKRFIDGKEALLFGPFAGFTTKFLKKGRFIDLFQTIKFSNISSMLKVSMHNFGLEKYLVRQVSQSFEQRIKQLKEFYPEVKAQDWTLRVAGQRVQVIKSDLQKGDVLQFGTEIVSARDGSLSALLGASPGASTAVSIMLDLIKKCFPEKQEKWRPILKSWIPSYEESLRDNPGLLKKVRKWTIQSLNLSSSLTEK